MANKKAVLPDLSRYMEGRKRHFITYFEGADPVLLIREAGKGSKGKLYAQEDGYSR